MLEPVQVLFKVSSPGLTVDIVRLAAQRDLKQLEQEVEVEFEDARIQDARD